MELFNLLESFVAESKNNKFSTIEAVKHLSKELKSLNLVRTGSHSELFK